MHRIREIGEFYFSTADYCVFAAMLILSTGTGVYFGWYKRRRVPIEEVGNTDDPVSVKKMDFGGSRSMSEYLLGSRKLHVFPVAMSLVASYISGVTILGTPSEIYNYGTQYWLIIVSIVFMAITVATVYLPVFSVLRVGSSYEVLLVHYTRYHQWSGVRSDSFNQRQTAFWDFISFCGGSTVLANFISLIYATNALKSVIPRSVFRAFHDIAKFKLLLAGPVAILVRQFPMPFTYVPSPIHLCRPLFQFLRFFKYLELRFSSVVRSIASFMFVMDEVFFLPIILYVPAIAFNQVTGMNIHLISAVVCVVCVFYTLIGGIKAVVHTDAWQVLVMFVSVIVVVILGSVVIGAPSTVFKEASEGGRLIFFDTDPSPYKRHTLWGVLIGGFLYWTSFNSVNQTMVQRYMSLPTLRKGQTSIAIFTVGIALFLSVCVYAGLLIYDFFKLCDPLSAKLITNDDQLFPFYVMQTVGHVKGVPGLFIAGVFGAALSSLSVVLNSTALVLLEDIVKGCFRVKLSDRGSAMVVKGSIIVLGAVALSLVIVIEKLGAILSVATSVTAIAAGTTFGIFTMGMLIPWSNTKGAIAGAIAGIVMSGWVSFGSQIALASERVAPHKLYVSIDDCPANITGGGGGINEYPDESDVFPLYRLSFHWINPIGVCSVLIVGTIVSFLTGPTKLNTLDARLISPVLHRFLPKECFPAANTNADITRENTVQTLTHLLGENSSTSDGNKGKQGPGKY